ncbi:MULTISPECIES: deoxyguanosinetriphosphate triphosphohydrolase [Thermodesulfobacterium]|jgi:dGTPase|uniref:deoxyguanosinetriphosphate triphosphohydrolase n=1 Tax=Thermodesulfobacterium sp. TaxID=1965289 RepID=UPI0003B2F8D1|nr:MULTISPECIES: deoxyguanosinetriphosphate triphosphohydrolase [Thermodesulfobacterium]KUJ97212.1 MAG: Deoxyguanosinetriphosphate triphosphohydrolase-like protein [Thermodesulfobacterium sp. 37_54]KUK19014.1 MAG: Deoxyguanosinetriphosphate triphosphohydrolase-like protein [Thermodesulfobacterium commune]MBZ4682434.1 deoxyguanosinetriphosphate triphosphohydrolase [Thermodesulfobacterium sp.]MDN5380320.1 dGTPase [Thermodesulfobacterium sp.]HBT03442.1 deoxyguanosinetriphosphate triphosphohydrola
MKTRTISIREEKEAFEELYLAPKACKSRFSRGRTYPEEECEIRTAFERDRDRIIHSKAFRRLKHKTQVFLAPKGDHYRTRLTHTLEVAQIARTIARALNLNETLTEAIALGHDLGHTPFGHAGEEVLNELLEGGFRHYEQSLRVVEKLEKDGRGLNLTFEVKEGILKHSKGMGPILSKGSDKPSTLEAEIVRVSDVIAYVNHDVDDALRAGMIDLKDLPQNSKKILGETHAQRISTLVKSIVYSTREANYSEIVMEDKVLSALTELREFLFEKIYFSQSVRKEFEKAKRLLLQLFEFYDKNFENIPYFIKAKSVFPDEPKERLIADYISGMTDRYAIYQYFECFVPKPWQGLEKVFGGIDYEL